MSGFESGAFIRSGVRKLLGTTLLGKIASGRAEPEATPPAPAAASQSPSPTRTTSADPNSERAVSEDGRYEFQQGQLFRRVAGKQVYRLVNSNLPKPRIDERILIRVSPLNPNYLWLGFGLQGLFVSLDGGQCFTKVPNITKVEGLLLKKDKSSEEGVRVQLSGSINQLGTRRFVSMDCGKSWSTATRSTAIDMGRVRVN